MVGRVQRRPLEAPIRRCESLVTTYVKRGRGRPIKTWNETIRKDMMYLDISETQFCFILVYIFSREGGGNSRDRVSEKFKVV
ncbi:hypothetical protein KSP40_PGU017160 [Platanthera guangdongensis]|uniref:Uncharacterized protein n=1 Tax=Platanthera guangdongensis TaxID=2320717 RepID=A0ABR2M6H9_9ASPA